MATHKKEITPVVEEELDPRWAKFVDLYIQSGNAYQSAVAAGFSENYALVITSRIPDKVIKSLNSALDDIGVTPVKIAEKINTLLEAKKKVRTYFKGDLTSEYEEEDHQAIDKGITHALKIGVGGGYAPEKSVQVQVTGDVKDFNRYQEIKAKYEQELLNTLTSES